MNQMSAVFTQIFQEFKQQLELEALMVGDSLYQKSKVLTYMKMAKSSFRAFFSLSMTLIPLVTREEIDRRGKIRP
jgi:hypothetical protein